MEIREIRECELDQLLELYRHLHAQDDPLPAGETVRATWSAIKADRDILYLGAYEGMELVGSCNLTVIPNLTRGCRPFAIIENVVTACNWRRQGIGKKLMKSALEVAWERNCYKVMLLTGRKDSGTAAFYENAGFDGTVKKAFVAKPPH